ncbi:MAG TPA: DMT family transporter [Sphingobium sp.]
MGISTTRVSNSRVPRFAFAALLLSNVILSLGPLLVRLADTGPVAAGFWRLALAVPLLIGLMLWRGESLRGLTPARWGIILFAGLFFAADLASWHVGILQTKVANAALFGNITSLLLPLWAIMALRQRPAAVQIVALLLAAVGVALLMGGSYELSPQYLRGDLFCILAGIMYTGYIVALQHVRQMLGGWAVLTVSSAAGVIPLLLFAILLGERIVPQDWTPLLILALSSQVIGQGLLMYALPWFSPLIVGLVLLVQPVIAALVGWAVFGETMTVTDMIGAVAVAMALVLVRLPARV